jgi:hypothetical protein
MLSGQKNLLEGQFLRRRKLVRKGGAYQQKETCMQEKAVTLNFCVISKMSHTTYVQQFFCELVSDP